MSARALRQVAGRPFAHRSVTALNQSPVFARSSGRALRSWSTCTLSATRPLHRRHLEMRVDSDSAGLRAEWTESIARAVGTLRAGKVVAPPPELIEVFDDAMRIHILDLQPRVEFVDAME